MVLRAREGIRCTSYRPIDYEQVKSDIAQRKVSGQASLLKLKCIKAASQQQKKENLGKQHFIVWQHELVRLGTLRQQLQSEVDTLMLTLVDSDDNHVKRIFEELNSFESMLTEDFYQFKESTTDAIWSLRSFGAYLSTFSVQLLATMLCLLMLTLSGGLCNICNGVFFSF